MSLSEKSQNVCPTHGRGELRSPAGDRRSPLRQKGQRISHSLSFLLFVSPVITQIGRENKFSAEIFVSAYFSAKNAEREAGAVFLFSEVCFFDTLVVDKVCGVALGGYASCFKDVNSVGHRHRLLCVLLNQQYRLACLAEGLDYIKYLRYKQGGQTH